MEFKLWAKLICYFYMPHEKNMNIVHTSVRWLLLLAIYSVGIKEAPRLAAQSRIIESLWARGIKGPLWGMAMSFFLKGPYIKNESNFLLSRSFLAPKQSKHNTVSKTDWSFLLWCLVVVQSSFSKKGEFLFFHYNGRTDKVSENPIDLFNLEVKLGE